MSEGVDTASALEETQAILNRASAVWSRWSCPATAECCQLAKTGRPPWLWPTEWQLLATSLENEGRALPTARPDGACRFLDETALRCTVYAVRPFGCRTFFCGRGQGPVMPGLRTHELLDALAQLNIAVDAAATPQPLEAWASATDATAP